MAQITMGIYWGILCSASCILFLGEVVYNLVFRLQKWRKRTVTIFVINLNLSWIVNRLVLIRNQAFALDFKVIKIIVTTIKSKNTG